MKFILTFLTFTVLGGCLVAQSKGAQEAGLSAETLCSRTRPGVPVAKLVWRVPRTVGEAAPAIQFLDVTTDKVGFEKKSFITIWPQRSEHNPAAAGAANGGRQLDPLRSLRVAPSGEAKSPSGRLVLLPEGLEAGVNYFWRLRTKTAQGWKNVVVETVGPVCPVDSQR
jgi:hypothetical protein